MLQNLLVGAIAIGSVNTLLGYIAVRGAKHLEQRFGLLRRMVLVQGLALVLVLVGIAIHASEAPRLSAVGEVVVEQLRSHLVEQRAHQQDALQALAAVVLLLIILLPPVLHVLREVTSFVATHRVDLLARDQAAAWTPESKPGSKPAP